MQLNLEFPEFVTCRCCGKSKPFDEGGVPCDPRHPYVMQWICDACQDELDFQPDHCRECEHYLPVNAAGGICVRAYRSGTEKPTVSSGHDDLVNADDWCACFRAKKEGVNNG